jgi:hypothetical protein
VADVVQLTIVHHGEAEVLLGLLRAYGVECGDRPANVSGENDGSFGGWREILVNDDDLETARELLAATPEKP